jgi:hypothetical protein
VGLAHPEQQGWFITADYENHYSPRFNKCFYLQKSNSVSETMDVQSFELYDLNDGPVAELVGIEVGVVSGVMNLESSGVEASDWRLRHGEDYHEA